MYGRYSAQSFGHVARQVRSHTGNAYHQVRNFAHKVDSGVQLASKVYAAVAPAIRDFAPEIEKRASKGVTQARSSYDSLKGDVMDVHSRGEAHAKRLKGLPEMLGL
jgi:hypothetical protein